MSSVGRCDTSDALIKYGLGVDQVYPGRPRLYLWVEFYPLLKEFKEILILHSKAYVYFIRNPGEDEVRIPFNLEHPVYISGSDTLKYYPENSLDVISYLEDFRRGANLRVAIYVSIKAFIMEKRTLEGKHYTLPVKLYTISCANKTNQSEHLLVTREAWYENILKHFNYPRRIAVELLLGTPPVPAVEGDNYILKELCRRLEQAQKRIEEGWKAIYTGGEIGRDKAIEEARKALELISPWEIAKTLNPQAPKQILPNIEQTLQDILLIKTGTTSSNMVGEVYGSLEAIRRGTKNIADKGPHAVTKRGEPMEYHPEHIDAETLLTIATAIIRYYTYKVQRYHNLTHTR